MAHCAELNYHNLVKRVVVVDDAHEDNIEEWCAEFFKGGKWKQTSYNGNIRKRFAGIGFKYDSTNDVFIPPKPFPSWTLNEDFDWDPPIPFPNNFTINSHEWDEENQEWKEL